MDLSKLEKEIYEKRPSPKEFPGGFVSADGYLKCVRGMVTPNRFAHVLRVSALAEEIAIANLFHTSDIAAIKVAAVLHDVARDLDFEEIFSTFRGGGGLS